MFGMLDYRAHKLYLILFGLPWFFIRWWMILALPFVYYYLGLAISEHRIIQIIVSIIALFFIEIIMAVVVSYIDRFFMFIFGLFVDVISAENRTKDESMFIVKTGELGIKTLNFDKKNPKDWTDEDIEFCCSGFFKWFFRDSISNRLEKIREYFSENQNVTYSAFSVKQFLSENNLSMSLVEQVVTNSQWRYAGVTYAITLYFLLVHPN